jgi:hypothetical protein
MFVPVEESFLNITLRDCITDFVDLKLSNQYWNRVVFDVSCYSAIYTGRLDFGDGSSVNLNYGHSLVRHDYQTPGRYKASISLSDNKGHIFPSKEIIIDVNKTNVPNSIYLIGKDKNTLLVKVNCFSCFTTLNWGDGACATNINADNNNTKILVHTYTPTIFPKTFIISLEATFNPNQEKKDYFKSLALFTCFESQKSSFEIVKTYSTRIGLYSS